MTVNREIHTRLFWFGLFTALLPMVSIHTTYLISAIQGHVDWCIPHWDSCTSISATGRNGLGYFVFRGAMIPALSFMAIFWFINHRWMQAQGYPRGRGLVVLGALASVFMLLYTLSLGHGGGAFELLRRIGVVGYIGMTGIAQITLGAALYRHPNPVLSRNGKRLLALSAFTLGLAIFSVILDAIPQFDYGQINHAFEWNLILLMNIHGVGVALLWRRTGLTMGLNTVRL